MDLLGDSEASGMVEGVKVAVSVASAISVEEPVTCSVIVVIGDSRLALSTGPDVFVSTTGAVCSSVLEL